MIAKARPYRKLRPTTSWLHERRRQVLRLPAGAIDWMTTSNYKDYKITQIIRISKNKQALKEPYMYTRRKKTFSWKSI